MVLAFPQVPRSKIVSLAQRAAVSLSPSLCQPLWAGLFVADWQHFLSCAGDFCLGKSLTDFASSLGVFPYVSFSGPRGCSFAPVSVLGRLSLWFSGWSLTIWSTETLRPAEAMCKYIDTLRVQLDHRHCKSK